MKSRHLYGTIACLAIMALLLASCSSGGPAAKPAAPPTEPAAASKQASQPTPTLKPADEQPRYGGVLAISTSVDPPSLDVHQEVSIAGIEPMAPVYDGLIQYDRKGNIVADLAERWDISPDGLVYTFYLRKGVKWHDGKPFSSADAKYNIERMKDPPKGVFSARKEQFTTMDRVETPDENTVKIVMKQAYVAFMGQFAIDGFVIMPKHILEAKGDMKKDAVGTGPFKFKSYSSGISVELVRNADYFLKGFPYLDGIALYIVKDGGSRFAAFRTGRVKMTGHVADLTPSEAATVKAEQPNLSIWQFPALQGPSHAINTTRPPFDDVRVRQAVGLAYDRTTAIKVVAQGEGRVGTFLPQEGRWGLPEADIMKLPGYRQPKDADRAEARRLLAEAGYPDGLKMTLLVRSRRLEQQAGEFMKNQLATVGINASIDLMETAVYNTRTLSGDFQMGTQKNDWRLNDPDELGRKFLTGAAQNYGKLSNKRFDDLFMEQGRTLDTAKRKVMARELDDILLRELSYVWPYWSDAVLGTWPEVKGFGPPPNMYSAMRLHDVWLAK